MHSKIKELIYSFLTRLQSFVLKDPMIAGHSLSDILKNQTLSDPLTEAIYLQIKTYLLKNRRNNTSEFLGYLFSSTQSPVSTKGILADEINSHLYSPSYGNMTAQYNQLTYLIKQLISDLQANSKVIYRERTDSSDESDGDFYEYQRLNKHRKLHDNADEDRKDLSPRPIASNIYLPSFLEKDDVEGLKDGMEDLVDNFNKNFQFATHTSFDESFPDDDSLGFSDYPRFDPYSLIKRKNQDSSNNANFYNQKSSTVSLKLDSEINLNPLRGNTQDPIEVFYLLIIKSYELWHHLNTKEKITHTVHYFDNLNTTIEQDLLYKLDPISKIIKKLCKINFLFVHTEQQWQFFNTDSTAHGRDALLTNYRILKEHLTQYSQTLPKFESPLYFLKSIGDHAMGHHRRDVFFTLKNIDIKIKSLGKEVANSESPMDGSKLKLSS